MAIRRVLLSVAVMALMVAVASPAMAGGGGGGSKSKVNIRVKNFGEVEVGVAVANKVPNSGFRGLLPTQVTQFKVNKGKFFVVDSEFFVPQEFNTGSRKTVYIAILDDGTAEDTTTRF